MDKDELATKEYFHLENEIGRYDSMCHSIKNWSITVGFALIAAGFTQSEPRLFLVASFASLLFWKTEARWKRIQRMHGVRLRALENHLNGTKPGYTGPGISQNIASLFLQYGKTPFARFIGITKREFVVMRYANVQLPYNVVFVSGLILFALVWCGIIAA